MGFVGSFVGSKTQVTVDAVDALLGLQVAQGRIEGDYGIDKCLSEINKLVVYGSPARLVGVEPITVVIDKQFVEKWERVGMNIH